MAHILVDYVVFWVDLNRIQYMIIDIEIFLTTSRK